MLQAIDGHPNLARWQVWGFPVCLLVIMSRSLHDTPHADPRVCRPVCREVEQFRDEVRNSPEVKFAVQVFSALSSNNFVRFFKLVKCASYLASCLLHRYFNQVGEDAVCFPFLFQCNITGYY